MKLYALCTLHETGWGTRQGVGLPEDAKIETEGEEEVDVHPGHVDPPITTSPRSRSHKQIFYNKTLPKNINPFKGKESKNSEDFELQPVPL